MNRSSLIFLFSISVFVGSSGVCWSAGPQKGFDAQERGDYATAIKEWTPLAKQGDVVAQYNLGLIYGQGKGIPKDYRKAIKWSTLAAEQGSPIAQTILSGYYFEGFWELPIDYERAYMWASIAAMSEHKAGVELRNKIENQMSFSQIEEGQKLARECIAKNYKGC